MQAQFILSMQLNTLLSLQVQRLDEERDNEQRFAHLPPITVSSVDPHVDLGSIAFVAVDDKVKPLQRVHAAQAMYLTALDILDGRNRFYRERVLRFDTEVGEFNVATGEEEIELDDRHVSMLKGLTDDLYEATDEAVRVERLAISELIDVSSRMFPRKPVVPTEPPFIQKPTATEG
jgi:hypothetical protein